MLCRLHVLQELEPVGSRWRAGLGRLVITGSQVVGRGFSALPPGFSCTTLALRVDLWILPALWGDNRALGDKLEGGAKGGMWDGPMQTSVPH